MPQTFNVVRCFQCLIYQVDIDKKSTNKWTCKMCGSKQTLKQVFYQGESKDCRERVKALNELKGKQQEEKAESKLINSMQYKQESVAPDFNQWENTTSSINKPFVSKWAKYLTKEDSDDVDNSDNEN